MTRRFPNGGTRTSNTRAALPEHIGQTRLTEGSEPSQYLEEKKTTVIPSVAASERGPA